MSEPRTGEEERIPIGVVCPDGPCDVCHAKEWTRRVELTRGGGSDHEPFYICASCTPRAALL